MSVRNHKYKRGLNRFLHQASTLLKIIMIFEKALEQSMHSPLNTVKNHRETKAFLALHPHISFFRVPLSAHFNLDSLFHLLKYLTVRRVYNSISISPPIHYVYCIMYMYSIRVIWGPLIKISSYQDVHTDITCWGHAHCERKKNRVA